MYLLDANAFMEANRLYYAFDLAPGFWHWLEDPALDGSVASIDAIKGEIAAGTGPLVGWAHSLRDSFWLPATDDTVAAMTEIAAWANAPERIYTAAAIGKFMASADLRLVAHAAVADGTVVTREQPAPDSKKGIKIPDVCEAFDVDWTNPFSAYRNLGLRLVA